MNHRLGQRRATLLAVALTALLPSVAIGQTPAAATTEAASWPDLAAAPPDIRALTRAEEIELGGHSANIAANSYQNAANGWEAALKLHEASYGPDHPRTAFIRIRLAEHWIDLRRYAGAQAQLDRADASLKARAAPGHPLRLAVLGGRSLLLWRQHRIADQIAVADQAVAELEAGVATTPAYRTAMTSWRGLIAARKGDYRAAETQLRAHYDAITAQPGVTVADRGSAADGLARQLIAMGRRREAVALLMPLIAAAGADEKANAAVLAAMLETVGEIAADYNQFPRADAALRKARLLRQDDEMLNPVRASATRIALRMARLLRGEDRFDVPFSGWGDDEKFTSALDLRRNLTLRDSTSAMAIEATADIYAGEPIWVDEVLPLRRKLLGWYEEKFGPDHPETARIRRALAAALADSGKPFSAERELQRSLVVQRTALPGPNEELGRSLTLLGMIYVAQGRRPEALAAYGEAVRNLASADGKETYWSREARFGQARLAATTGDKVLADAIWQRASDTARVEPDEAGTMTVRQGMAILQGYIRNQIDGGTCPSATERKLLAEMVESLRKTLIARTGIVETGFYTLAEAEACAGKFELAARAVDGAKTSTVGMSAEDFGRDAENVAIRQVRLVRAFMADAARMRSDSIGTSSFQAAANIGMELSRAETAARNLVAGASSSGGGGSDLDAIRARSQQEAGGRSVFDFVFSTRLDFDWRVHELQDGAGPVIDPAIAVLRSGLAIGAAQDLERASAAQVLAQASARLGSQDTALGALLREREKLSGEQRRLAASLAIASIGGANDAAAVRVQSDAALARLATLDARLLKDFPDYFALTKPDSLSIAAIQDKLAPNEGLLMVQPNGADLHVFVVTKRRVAWNKLAGASREVAGLVDALRCDIDAATCRAEGAGGSRGASRGAPKLRSGAPVDPAELALWQAPTFDRTKAWRLNQLILEPLAPVLAKDEVFGDEITRLYTVVGGPLSALPLGLLVTAQPADGGKSTTGPALLDAPWLANKYTLIGLPSVASLALKPPPAGGGGAALVGYGDPVLLGEPQGGTEARSVLNMVAREDDFLRARPDALRKMDPLPGTEQELNAVAGLFAPGSALVRLQGAATETAVKRDQALAKARIVIFSTHGLLPGEAVGDVEPGLVLTPPALASELDDGLLTASEAATLELDADLLVLSACNTATTDGTPGAESLSSLSRAFLYAGARGIYASHWRVSDDVTARLITIALGLRRDGRTRADSLALAMKAVRSGVLPDGSAVPGWTPDWAHPAAWAPFVVLSGADG